MKRFFLALGFLLVGMGGSVFSQPPNPYTFWPDVEVTEAPPDDGVSQIFFSSGQHYTAFRGDTVYVVWWEARSSTPPIGNHVLFAKSTDVGQSFGPNVRVNNLSSAFNPSMRVDTAGVVYVAYQSNADIYFSKSTDGGTTFTPGVKVNDDTISQIGQEKPAIAVNNKGQIFIAWRDQRTAPGEPHKAVFAAASYDGGQTFTANVQGNEVGTIMSGGIDIATNDSGVFVVYRGTTGGEFGIVVARSIDSGQNYSYHVLCSDLPPPDSVPRFAEDPSIAIYSDGSIGVAWQDSRFDQWTLRFSSSTDFGQTFSPSIRVDDDVDLGFQSQPLRPSLACKSGVFYVTWNEYRIRPSDSAKVPNVWFSYLQVGDSAFAKTVDVNASDTSRSIGRQTSSVAVNGEGKIYVAWVDNRYDLRNSFRLHVFGAVGDTNLVKGDLNLDRLLTVVDIVMQLNAVFVGLSFPAPFTAADGNCDGILSPSDVILLLNAVFLGSLFPCN